MSQKKILLVDDDPIILKTLSLKLQAAGYDTISAKEGAQAGNAVRNQKPELVLLDLTFQPPDSVNMGGVQWDGFLIMQWLRRLEGGNNIPIIIVTGGDPKRYKKRALEEGAVGFFTKPVNHDELIETIRKTIGEPSSAQVAKPS